MNYEQKYKEALERAKDYIEKQNPPVSILYEIFPELKESEDEKIRKWLICGMNALKEQKKETFATIPIDDAIAWLEKQSEQKPAVVDFNAKDWYVSKVDGKIHDMTYNSTDRAEPNSPSIIEENPAWSDEDELIVLSIEQVIKAASLLNIVPEKLDKIDKWLKSIRYRVQPQPKEWNEEDENMANDLIEGCLSSKKIHHLVHTSKEIADWLKSLKDRVKGKEEKK